MRESWRKRERASERESEAFRKPVITKPEYITSGAAAAPEPFEASARLFRLALSRSSRISHSGASTYLCAAFLYALFFFFLLLRFSSSSSSRSSPSCSIVLGLHQPQPAEYYRESMQRERDSNLSERERSRRLLYTTKTTYFLTKVSISSTFSESPERNDERKREDPPTNRNLRTRSSPPPPSRSCRFGDQRETALSPTGRSWPNSSFSSCFQRNLWKIAPPMNVAKLPRSLQPSRKTIKLALHIIK